MNRKDAIEAMARAIGNILAIAPEHAENAAEAALDAFLAELKEPIVIKGIVGEEYIKHGSAAEYYNEILAMRKTNEGNS